MVRFLPDANEGLIVGYWQQGEPIQDDTPLGRMITFSGDGPSEVARTTGRLTRYEQNRTLRPDWRERLRTGRAGPGPPGARLGSRGTVTATVKQVVAAYAGAASRSSRTWSRPPSQTPRRARSCSRRCESASARTSAARGGSRAAASEERPESVFKTVAEEVGRCSARIERTSFATTPRPRTRRSSASGKDRDAEDLVGRRMAVDRGPYRTIRELGRPIRFELDGDIPLTFAIDSKPRAASVVIAPILVSGDCGAP